ncbi:MAG TPA: glycosyltransferase [Steroidobacteraceae bacterium]|nr:glycosyltransferase [Steroidobacteraceae bacterium]
MSAQMQARLGPAPATGAAQRLRILHVVPTYYPAVRYGGPIRSVHGLATALAGRGHDVHVYTSSMDGDADLDVPLDRPVCLDGVSVHYFPVPALRRLCWAPRLARTLRADIGGFDILHLHSVFLWPTAAAARIAARAGVPYVLAPRGMLVGEMIRRRSRWIKTAWIGLIEHRSLAAAAAVHVTAQLEAEELRKLGLPLPPIECIPNGVEYPAGTASGATPHEAETTLPARYALFLSRISWKKGLDRLISAWQQVPELPLVIAGNDDEGYRPRLEALARELGVAGRVLFLGPVADDRKWAIYRDAALFLLPSYSENFGNVVAEAMAMGCPVVVTPEVGIAALVAEAGAGVVCGNEPAQLAAAISGLLADERRRQDCGRRGRELVRTRLSWDGLAAQAEDLYRNILVRTSEPAASGRLM